MLPQELGGTIASASLSFASSSAIWQGIGAGRPPRGLLFDRFLSTKRRNHERETLQELLLVGLGTALSAVSHSVPGADAGVVAALALEQTILGSRPSDKNWQLLRFADLRAAKSLVSERLAGFVQCGPHPQCVASHILAAHPGHPRFLVASAAIQAFGTPLLKGLFDEIVLLCRQLAPGVKPHLYDGDFVRLAVRAMPQDG